MFKDVENYVNKSLNTIYTLSFDVITVVVSARDVINYFNEVIQTFQTGTDKVNNQLNHLCSSFLNLTNYVEQDYLNNLNISFNNLINQLNDTIFSNVT